MILQLKKEPVVIGEVNQNVQHRLAQLKEYLRVELAENGNTVYAQDLRMSIERFEK